MLGIALYDVAVDVYDRGGHDVYNSVGPLALDVAPLILQHVSDTEWNVILVDHPLGLDDLPLAASEQQIP